jgi:hypothetical protein
MKTKTSLIAFFFLFKCLIGLSQNNTATGTSAGLGGTLNSSFGYFAGNKVTGQQNTFIGTNAGFNNTTGSYNTLFGTGAGYSNVSGSYNTLVGYQAGYNSTGSNNIFIGKQAGYGETGSNKLYIGNGDTNPLIFGDFNSRQVKVNGYLIASQVEADHLRTKYSLLFDHATPEIYLGQSEEEMNRYLRIINSEDLPTPAGLKSGGILVSDDFNFADPSKNSLIVKGSIGVGTAGTTTPGAKLSFSDATTSSAADGITWYNPSPLEYGIYKTSGAWSYPNYQQLKLRWPAGIVLDPGISFPKSFVEIGGGGLRVTSGNVGIGTTTPAYKLDVVGTINATNILINGQPLAGGGSSQWATNGNNISYATGNVGIGTTTPDAKLAVKGTIHTNEVKVDMNGAVAPDYVFEKDYNLMSLEDTEAYIAANKHLPEVPSAKEMEKNGVQLGEMNMLLLKKVEELTLHLIEQNRKLDEMKKENEAQNEVIKSLIDKQKK